jgi:hypothetical protein
MGCEIDDDCEQPGESCVDGICIIITDIFPERANDGIDNDGDGRIDCADLDSVGQTGPCGELCEQPETICDDSFDNDGDGKIDCADPDCEEAEICEFPEQTCNDGFDNDGDGDIDCNDLNCVEDPLCN